MKTYITLFKGVNVSGKNIMPMKDLASLLDSAGYSNVRTYIQSGNVVYQTTRSSDKKIADLVESKFGFRTDTMTLTSEDFAQIRATNPYKEHEGKTVHFFFLFNEPTASALEKLNAIKSDTEEIQLLANVLYLHAPAGIGRSKLVAKIDKTLGIKTTARNLNTINKLWDLV